MEKVFHFDSPRDHYESDATILWCFDYRFQAALSKFIKRLGIANPDLIRIAGAAQSLASPAQESDRDFVVRQIQTSVRLHQAKLIILTLHSDCGAYGGLAAFGNNPEEEARAQERELRKAAEYVSKQVPGIAVQAYFIGFEGVWAIDVSGAAAAATTGCAAVRQAQ